MFTVPNSPFDNKVQSIINNPIFIETFLTQFEGCFAEIEPVEPIRIRIKSYQLTKSGIDIEFQNEDDANLFWNNQDKEIELIFNSQE